jgi:hypothetical protein
MSNVSRLLDKRAYGLPPNGQSLYFTPSVPAVPKFLDFPRSPESPAAGRKVEMIEQAARVDVLCSDPSGTRHVGLQAFASRHSRAGCRHDGCVPPRRHGRIADRRPGRGRGSTASPISRPDTPSTLGRSTTSLCRCLDGVLPAKPLDTKLLASTSDAKEASPFAASPTVCWAIQPFNRTGMQR